MAAENESLALVDTTGMPGMDLERALASGAMRFSDALDIIDTASRRLDLAELPLGAAACVLSQTKDRWVWLVPDEATAIQCQHDLRFFAEQPIAAQHVARFPAHEITPFVDLVSDRHAAMQRLSILAMLTENRPWRHLVLPAAAFLRKTPPKEVFLEKSYTVIHEDALDREALLALLNETGYTRVPVVEDRGTYSARGAIIDVFSPVYAYPVRIELDDYLVISLKHFDPESQRSLGALDHARIIPVREMIADEKSLARAVESLRHQCDQINLPTSQTRQILDTVQSGRGFPGMEGFLPAYHRPLSTCLDFLPADCRIMVFNPTGILHALEKEESRARQDRQYKIENQQPVYDFEDLFLPKAAALDLLEARSPILIHDIVLAGKENAPEGFFASSEDVMRFGCSDHRQLRATLGAHRQSGRQHDVLIPLMKEISGWRAQGFRILLTSRTSAQADRLYHLLEAHGVSTRRSYEASPLDTIRSSKPEELTLHVGELSDGFTCPTEALVCLTEEEIFGSRRHQPKRPKGLAKHPFVRDLRSLRVGDYIVHPEHGIGRYLGLEKTELPVSKMDQLRGVTPVSLEVLVVEYAQGAKLYLPITRLNQIQKFSSKEGHSPSLDRLGGQSFSRTKAKVRQAVRQLADHLLALYAQRSTREKKSLSPPDPSFEAFEAAFPFEETSDQSRAIHEVLSDLEKPAPMDRVICGDVGFGKTEVALRAAFRIALAGRQVALLCPTTVLAQQHYRTFVERLRDYPLSIEVLSRFVPKTRHAEILARIKNGSCDIVVGTHRILSKDVHFHNLGLLIVDEEQRFGVTHKERIKQLRSDVDVLTLTATPIPRTLQMAIGGLRDLSLITTPPVDRRAVRTFITRFDEHVLREAIRRELARGGQTFFVYNRVEGLYERAQRIQDLVPEARVAVAHAQMKDALLETIMTDFVDGEYDILCSTAIVESGLDIPRANTIIIDGAELLGLSQLYQLRGRVGRSKERAYCYLVVPSAVSLNDDAKARIEALERLSYLGAGFHIASLDMDQRGAGDLLGSEQSGHVAAVGFDLFVSMLEEAVAQLRGQPVIRHIDPELTLDIEQRIPDDYIEDIGVRLSFYQRLAAAQDEDAIIDIANEMEERFGPPPKLAQDCIRVMSLKPKLRALKALGLEATRRRVTLHLSQDTPLDAKKVTALVGEVASDWAITPDMKLTRRIDVEDGLPRHTLTQVEDTLRILNAMLPAAA